MADILLLDDSLTQIRVLERTLADAGYRVTSATDLREVRRLRRRIHPRIALIELVRYQGNGFTLACAIRRMGLAVPVLMSARREPSDRYWAEARGITCLLERPQPPDRFLAALERIMRETQHSGGGSC